MQNAVGHRKIVMLLVLMLCGALSWPVEVRAGGESCPDSLKPERKLETFEEYPFYKGQKVQVMELANDDSMHPVWAGGIASAMQHVGPEVAASKPVIDRVVGPPTGEFDIAVGLNGSAARYALFGSANDLDILVQLVIKVKNGSANQLFDAHGAPVQKITRYLQDHVEQVLRENPSYRFIELKAGEFIDPQTGEKAGIKWWLRDLRRGYKIVHEAGGPRRVTLSQAISEPARIKIDWAVPSPLDAWITEANRLGSPVPSATRGGLHIMGRQNQVIAMKFERSPEFSALAKSMKGFATKVGGTPEKTYFDFSPHITIAMIKGKETPTAQAQVRDFLAESTGALSEASFEGFEILTRAEKSTTLGSGASGGNYTKIR
jgi:hypothetical protein